MLAANFALPWWRQTTVADYQAGIMTCQEMREHACMNEFEEQHATVSILVDQHATVSILVDMLPSGCRDRDTRGLI